MTYRAEDKLCSRYWPVGNRQGAVGKKTRLPIAFNVTLVLLFRINYLIGRDLKIWEPDGYPYQKRNNNLFIVIPAGLAGWAMRESRNLLCRLSRTGLFVCVVEFSFGDLADSLSRKIPTHRLQGMTMLETKEWQNISNFISFLGIDKTTSLGKKARLITK